MILHYLLSGLKFMKLNQDKCHLLASRDMHEKIGKTKMRDSYKQKRLGVVTDRNLNFEFRRTSKQKTTCFSKIVKLYEF